MTNGKKVVAVSGYFDPLHIGHIEYLELAKELGDKLVVILNNDEQAKLKKGKVFMPFEERIRIINALECVDDVFPCVDKDRSVCESLKIIKPNIFANGGDRIKKGSINNNSDIPEVVVCRELGIKIVDGLGKKIQSSSELIKKSDGDNDEKG